jgi:hypothetical protein
MLASARPQGRRPVARRNWPALLLALAASLVGCWRRTLEPPVDDAQLRSAYHRSQGRPRLALELAEALKCRALRSRLRALNARPHDLGGPLNRVPLPDLAPDQALLSLYVEGDAIHRYLARAKRVHALPRLDRPRFEALVIKTRDELEHGDLSPQGMAKLVRLLSRLYGEIFDNARSHLAGVRRLLVLPDGMAVLVPVHALVEERSSRPRFVAESTEVVYAPCLALARHPGRPRRATIFVPSYGGGHRPATALAEARAVARRFSRASLHASPARFVAALSQPGTAVHFAGHGLADLEPGTTPELLFAEDQPALGLAQLTARRVRSPLVVLAACGAAHAARFRDGQRRWSRTTPVEALLAAGASTVIAAAWSVKDRQSLAQMELFYANLARQGPAAAMGQAYRHAIARLRPPHPRFWAFYAVHGAL